MLTGTEKDWLAISNPPVVLHRSGAGVWDNPRFRWLAIGWMERIRDLTPDLTVLETLEGYKRLAREGIPLQDPRMRLTHNDVLNLPPLSLARCFPAIDDGHWAQAATIAANIACQHFPEPPADPSARPGTGRKGKARVGMRDQLAYKSQFAKWAKAKQAHYASIGKRFCDEFRDVAGNPFRPVAFDPAWRTETVVSLAGGIDESDAYERQPILADALEEAGCTDPQVLSHAREPGVHVRGCWLIDMILGRW